MKFNSRLTSFEYDSLNKDEIITLHIQECELINELIGSFLSKKMGLNTAFYKFCLSEDGKSLYALSKILYQPEYTTIKEVLKRDRQSDLSYEERPSYKLYHLKNKTLEFYKGTLLFSDILKVTAIDLKMGHWNRSSCNMQVKVDSFGTLTLGPIFDYQSAYSKVKDYYTNSFLSVKNNYISLNILLKKYPELCDYIRFLNSFSISEILSRIEEEKKVEFSNQEKIYYQERQSDNDKVISKVKRLY